MQGETEQLREEYGFQYLESEGKQLQELLEKKKDDKARQVQGHGKQAYKGKGGKKANPVEKADPKSLKDAPVDAEAIEQSQAAGQGSSVRDTAR